METKKSLTNILLLCLFLMFSMSLMAQQPKESRKEKKARQKKEQEVKFLNAKALLYDTAFVVPANNISLNNGQTFNINNTINFLRLSGHEGAIQISAYLAPDRGLNNTGELFVKGPITFVNFIEKNDRVTLSFLLNGETIKLRITVSICGSDQATVFVDQNIGGPAFQLSGKMVQFKDAQIYERKLYSR